MPKGVTSRVAARRELLKQLITNRPLQALNVPKLAERFDVHPNQLYIDLRKLKEETTRETREDLAVQLILTLRYEEAQLRRIIDGRLQDPKLDEGPENPRIMEPADVRIRAIRALNDVTRTMLDIAARLDLIDTREPMPVATATLEGEDDVVKRITLAIPNLTREQQLAFIRKAHIEAGSPRVVDTEVVEPVKET